MKNKISDMRNHMFAALERLSDEKMTPEQIDLEVKRSKAISDLGKVIVESAKTELLHAKLVTGKVERVNSFMDEDITNAAEPKKIERPPAVYTTTGSTHLNVIDKYKDAE